MAENLAPGAVNEALVDTATYADPARLQAAFDAAWKAGLVKATAAPTELPEMLQASEITTLESVQAQIVAIESNPEAYASKSAAKAAYGNLGRLAEGLTAEGISPDDPRALAVDDAISTMSSYVFTPGLRESYHNTLVALHDGVEHAQQNPSIHVVDNRTSEFDLPALPALAACATDGAEYSQNDVSCGTGGTGKSSTVIER